MAVTHAVFTRNAYANLLRGYLTSGHLVFLNATNGLVADLRFNATAAAAAATGQIVFHPITSDTAAVGGVTTKASLRTATSGERVACSVTSTSGGGDIKLPSTTIAALQTVSCNSLRYQAPA